MPDDYGACAECGEHAPLYNCFYCDAEELCWDCLQEHKEEYHKITKKNK
jgi:hypothetical protein